MKRSVDPANDDTVGSPCYTAADRISLSESSPSTIPDDQSPDASWSPSREVIWIAPNMSVGTEQRMRRSITTQYINERVEDVPLRILNRGPEYIRSRMMDRDSALFRHNRRSAVEMLAESRPQYLKSPTKSPENKSPAIHKVILEREDTESRSRSSSQCTGDSYHATASAQSVPCTPDREQVHPRQSETPPCIPDRGIHSKPVTLHRKVEFCPITDNKVLLTRVSGAVTAGETSPCQTSSGGRDNVDGPLPYKPPVPVKPVLSPKPVVPPKPKVAAKPSNPSITHLVQSINASRPNSLPTQVREHSFSGENDSKQKRPRYNGTVSEMAVNMNCPQSGSDINREIPTIAMEEWRDNRTDVSSDPDQQSSHSSVQDSNIVIKRRQGKVISRSRSDLTKRLSNGSDLSELSARFHRNSADLEKFFNQMGLDHTVLEPLKLGHSATMHSTSSLNLLESVSCLGSADARSCLSDDSQLCDGHFKPQDGNERTIPSRSIVERNARIIKWLCGIKMATGMHGSQQSIVQQKGAD